jgi:glutamate-1-semialdehyde 2,1-aminomutase
MINHGILLPPSQFEGIFLSTTHTLEDVERTLDAMEASFNALRNRE